MLDDTAKEGMEDIISWQPDGKSFRVHKPKEFAANVMPRFFKKIKYRSWQRQLHIYGFRLIKNKKSLDHGAYQHPQFVRGQKDLCLQMTRDRMNKGGSSSEGLVKDKLRSCLSKNDVSATTLGKKTEDKVFPMRMISAPIQNNFQLVNTPVSTIPKKENSSALEWVSFAKDKLRDPKKVPNKDVEEIEEWDFCGMRFHPVPEPEETVTPAITTQPQSWGGMLQYGPANPAA